MAQQRLDLAPLATTGARRMEQAVAAVRAAIADGRMTPGVRYSVYQLAEALGVSRTPVREALLRLEEIGLITFQARQGFQIRLPRPADIAEIFAVRLALEPPAVRRVAGGDGRFDDALRAHRTRMHAAALAGDEPAFAGLDQGLHDLILAAAGNERARRIVAGLRETTRLLGASTADTTRTLLDIDAEHTPIVTAILARRPDRAVAAMESHLVTTGTLLVRQALTDQHGDAGPAVVAEVWAQANG